MHVALVVNPASGKRKGAHIGQQVRERLRSKGHTVIPVERGGLPPALSGGADTVVVVGGDGAIHDVLEHVAETSIRLGLVPAGTGNDTARSLGIPTDDTEAAIDLLLAGHTRSIDLASVSTDEGKRRFVVTVVASGFDSKVNERANAMRWPRGNMKYNVAIVAELRTFSPLSFTLTLDGGEVLHRRAMLTAVGNGPSFGGGLRICEGAILDDGLLDVVVINPVSKLMLLRVFPQLYQGTHTSLPQFERHRVREVTLKSPGIVAYGDGERLGPLPRTVCVHPGALTVVCAGRP